MLVGRSRGLAVFLAVIRIIASVALGWFVSYYTQSFWGGLAIIVVGILLSWLGQLLLYGYGELIFRTTRIEEELRAFGKKKHKKKID